MTPFDVALVVDPSSVARQLAGRFLRRYAKTVREASSVEEARALCERETPALVVLDVQMEEGLAWFRAWRERAARPAFLFVTSRPSEVESAELSMQGAIGYLAKPFSFRELMATLVASEPAFEPAPPRVRAHPLADVAVQDPATGLEQVSCELRDLSADGAFLAAPAPIAVGTMLRLRLCLDGVTRSLTARVVRIQEPEWGIVSGWGVIFAYEDEEERAFVARFVEAHAAAS